MDVIDHPGDKFKLIVKNHHMLLYCHYINVILMLDDYYVNLISGDLYHYLGYGSTFLAVLSWGESFLSLEYSGGGGGWSMRHT